MYVMLASRRYLYILFARLRVVPSPATVPTAPVTTQARQEIRTRCGLTSEAYGSAWENPNLRSIDTYRSCTKGLQKTAYLHPENSLLKYTKEGELSQS
jgi:hypothetical protein